MFPTTPNGSNIGFSILKVGGGRGGASNGKVGGDAFLHPAGRVSDIGPIIGPLNGCVL